MLASKKVFQIMLAMIIAIFMINAELTSFSVVLHSIAQSMSIRLNLIPWIVTVYLLFFGSVMAIGGKLGDHYGHRKILLLGLVLFGVASLLGGFSEYFSELLVARVLQGISAALIFPMSTAIAFDVLPAQKKV